MVEIRSKHCTAMLSHTIKDSREAKEGLELYKLMENTFCLSQRAMKRRIDAFPFMQIKHIGP